MMALDKIRLANQKWKKEHHRKQKRAYLKSREAEFERDSRAKLVNKMRENERKNESRQY
jgi:hypothetical protein